MLADLGHALENDSLPQAKQAAAAARTLAIVRRFDALVSERLPTELVAEAHGVRQMGGLSGQHAATGVEMIEPIKW